MSQGYFPLAPDLELLVSWSSRMVDMLYSRYGGVMCVRLEAEEALTQSEYGRWCRTKAAAYAQIQRIWKVTASLPVVGDHLEQSGDTETLRIDKRRFFTVSDSEPILLVYEVSSEELEDWEDDLSQQQEADAEEVVP